MPTPQRIVHVPILDAEQRDQVAASVITKHKGALLAAAAASVAPGLLGEYLRGSPKLNDLLAVWDLDIRKVRASLPYPNVVV